MKITKLLKKAKPLLSDKERSSKKKRKYLKHVIKKLKNYEKDLKEKIQKKESAADRSRTQKKILLAHSQRKKALKKHKALLRK